MSLRIIIGLSSSIIIILANDAWMGYLEMQSCILPAIKHSGKNPPQLLVSRNMTASETVDGAVLKDIQYKAETTMTLSKSWSC